jgi:hypothetical protein
MLAPFRHVVLGFLILLGALLGASCRGNPRIGDPVVTLHTSQGDRSGVSTDWGILFVSDAAESGEIELTAWFLDGPSEERGIVEPIAAGLFATEAEIELARVPVTFAAPPPGERVRILGRRDGRLWDRALRVAEHPQVQGLLLEDPGDLPRSIEGAGIYVTQDGELVLVGLVTGRLTLLGPGRERMFLTAAGPEALAKLVTRRRTSGERKPWVYREDVF